MTNSKTKTNTKTNTKKDRKVPRKMGAYTGLSTLCQCIYAEMSLPMIPTVNFKTKTKKDKDKDKDKILKRPNICYIFEKLRVQGCQIWHSYVSIPFNSAPAHSTRPHNAKKLFTSSFQAKFLKIRFTKFTGTTSFWCTCKFSFSTVFFTPMGIFGPKYPAVPHL